MSVKKISDYFKVSLLIAVLLLIKIGQVLLILFKFHTLLSTPYHQPRRGRPRKTSLLPFYLRKIKKAFNYLIPKSSRPKLALISLFVILLINSLIISKLLTKLPSPYTLTTTQRPLTTEIYDREGRLLYQVYEGRNRKLIKLDEIPAHIAQATIAIEDKHFYLHPGIDPLGIARAFKSNFPHWRSSQPTPYGLQGGSTITQQLIKNTLLSSDQTFNRKIKEALLAFWAERIYSKQEILQMYLNESPYGGPAWGIEAASQMYFGKKTVALTLAESSYLAGLPAAPTQFSPYGVHPEQGKKRQEKVLKRMVEDGYISPKEAEETLFQPLTFQPPTASIKAPHFVMYVRSLLAQKYGERVVSQGGLKVITTLDLDIQEMAESKVFSEVEKLKGLKVGNGAAMVMEAKSGQILAMVGSKDYFNLDGGNVNVALSLRQPGSAVKVITYATAFKQGFGPGTILLDTPTTFPNPWGKAYTPVNYDGRFYGPVTVRAALGSSLNIPAVKMLSLVGIPNMLETARDMGITTLNNPENYGLSLTLGGGGVKIVEMMAVYNTLASGGVYYHPQPILTVTDPQGNILEDNKVIEGRRVLTEEVAYLLNNILSDNNARILAFGVNSLLKIEGKTVAVKTGTSDDKRDNWAFGFTPEFVVGTWVGNNDYSPMDQKLASGITGATPIWHDIMSNLLFDRPDIAFKRPAGIIETTNNGYKDLSLSGQTPKIVVGYKKVKQKDEVSKEEKEIITFSDPFSIYIPEKTTQ